VIAMMTINALVGVIAMPHHMAICGAGKSEANCRTGLTYGNVVKRFATLAWAFTGVMGAVLLPGMVMGHREQALGALIRDLLPAGLVGLMVAAMLASLMAVCDAYMVDGAALYTRNVYRRLSGSSSDDRRVLRVGRISSVAVAAFGVVCAFLLADVLTGLTIIWKITAFFGIPFWLAVFWQRGNRYGLWASLGVTTIVAVATQALGWTLADQIAAYLPAGVVSFIGVSLLTPPEPREKLKAFYFLLHTPVGEEQRLKDSGLVAVLEGHSVASPSTTPGVPLEDQGHSLLVVDLLSLARRFSFRRYRVDILGFAAAALVILGIIAAGMLVARLGA
jgi:Na+/proline symporter